MAALLAFSSPGAMLVSLALAAAPAPAPASAQDPGPEAEAPATNGGGGVAGSTVAADDEDKNAAQDELEGMSGPRADVPDTMPPLVTAGWWGLFGTLALATTGGVLAGLAESQEVKLQRMADALDIETGSKLNYADIADDYEAGLQRGRGLERGAWALTAVAGAVLVTSVVLLTVGTKRRGREGTAGRSRRGRFSLSGATVKF